MRSWIARHPLFCFCLASAAWLAILYAAVLNAPFVYDDIDQIANNPALQSWHAVYAQFILAPVSFTSGFLGSGGTLYRPLFWISLALDQHLWGAEAGGFHFTSLLLHWFNGLLLFQLLRRLKLPLYVSGFATLVWLGLPINTEVVAWISGRPYLLSTAFLLLALHAALSYARSKHWLPLAAFITCALLADFSHEQGLLLVALLGLAYLANPSLPGARKDSRPWIVLATLSVLADALFLLGKFAVGAHGGDGSHTLWSVGLKFWRYVQLIALPIHMSMERSSVAPSNTPSLAALLAWAALIGLVLTALSLRNRAPVVAAGLATLLIGLLPYCGFVYIYQGMAERYDYLASIGFVLTLVGGLLLVPQFQRRILLGCLGIWIAWGVWRTIVRVQDWEHPLALYLHSLEATPRSAFLQKNLGDIYTAQGDPHQAVAAYTRSLALSPNDPKTLLNDAAALQQTGNPSQAEAQYRRVIELRPHDSAAYVDLESLDIEQHRFDDAIAMYKQAIAVNPNDANAYFDLAVMFQQLGQTPEAMAFYKKVLQLKPGDPQTLSYMSKLQGPAQ
ncbi:MAG TPA: tetratricopeptide repeat protein [Acidobacteriaceae bacterium]|jgi:tetratricopeptide (TPR) repeat protein|nr:tetratricopeptide repeat protein [Acidobacteriaceae bacterium]